MVLGKIVYHIVSPIEINTSERCINTGMANQVVATGTGNSGIITLHGAAKLVCQYRKCIVAPYSTKANSNLPVLEPPPHNTPHI